ncbi:unnamed protein product (mitochondrion) [Plasmodiophora brassicae]|uniref:Kinetochore protein NDC80 n=2 Tax=Plasmodiophora brassicae TaxID=37360 RepID=A0A3P3YNI6_PLABS|nr:unnamed protein product [Plasmodiophora brassicae]
MTVVTGGGSGRRHTLGALSSSAANVQRSRPSLGVMAKPPRTSLGRLSISSTTRRSSMYGQRLTTTINDPRPISAKAFQQDNIRALIKFLTLHGYDREISPKILFTPSRNDFVYILTFLARHIDPNFNFDPSNQSWVEDFPIFFETIGYPFKISKRSLLSVGSPHTWPSLLAALVWLIDLLGYMEKVEGREQESREAAGEKMFYCYLTTAYVKFLDGADNYSFMESGVADQFKEKNAAIESTLEQSQREVEDLRAEVAALQAGRSALSDASGRRRAVATDIAKFEKLAAELEEYRKNLTKTRSELEQQLEAQRALLCGAEAEEGTLRDQLSKQEISAADVAHINAEKQMLQQTLSKLASELEQLKKRQWEVEMEIAASIGRLEQSAHSYTQTALLCGLLPPESGKHAYGIDYTLELDTTASSVETILLRSDLKRVVKPALHKLKDSFAKTLRKMAVEKRRAQEALTLSSDLRAEKADELSSLQARLAKLESAYREQRELKNAELKDRVAKIEDMELEIASLFNSQSTALSESEAALFAARSDLSRLQASATAEQCALRDIVTQMMEDLATHKVHIAAQLSQLDDLAQSFLATA